MPYHLSLDAPTRIVRSRGWGRLSEADIAAHMQAVRDLFKSGAIDETWAQLTDLSATTDVPDLSAEAVRRIAQANPWPAGVLRAFVTPQAVVFGLTRMYQIMAELDPERTTVCTTADEALSWILARRAQSDPPI